MAFWDFILQKAVLVQIQSRRWIIVRRTCTTFSWKIYLVQFWDWIKSSQEKIEEFIRKMDLWALQLFHHHIWFYEISLPRLDLHEVASKKSSKLTLVFQLLSIVGIASDIVKMRKDFDSISNLITRQAFHEYCRWTHITNSCSNFVLLRQFGISGK